MRVSFGAIGMRCVMLLAGASDNLAADASTFMLEMVEAACFLKDATSDRYERSQDRDHGKTFLCLFAFVFFFFCFFISFFLV